MSRDIDMSRDKPLFIFGYYCFDVDKSLDLRVYVLRQSPSSLEKGLEMDLPLFIYFGFNIWLSRDLEHDKLI